MDVQLGRNADISGLTGCVRSEGGQDFLRSLPDSRLWSDRIAITLEEVLVDAELADWQGEVKRFAFTRLLYENLTEYLIPTYQSGTSAMIDQEGFQHSDSYSITTHTYLKTAVGLEEMAKPLKWPQLDLQGRAKTRGWIAFEMPESGSPPAKFTFDLRLYESGQTSGWFRGTETFVFAL